MITDTSDSSKVTLSGGPHYANLGQQLRSSSNRYQNESNEYSSLATSAFGLSPTYASLPSNQSAFRPPHKPPRKCNNSELEEYAKQYEDLYFKRMWSRNGSTPTTQSNASMTSVWSNRNSREPIYSNTNAKQIEQRRGNEHVTFLSN